VRRLTGKDGYGILNRFRLVLLDFKFELHNVRLYPYSTTLIKRT
jgi:hypothetical protein